MSVEPPPSGRPTGPPSGPLSGPSEREPTERAPTEVSGTGPPPTAPGTGGPSGPFGPGGTGGGGPSGPGEPGGGTPWWKSLPRVAVFTTVVAAVVVAALLLTRPGGSGGGDVRLEAAGATGRDPFTESTAEESSPPPATPSVDGGASRPGTASRVKGSQPGLYGGTRKTSSCDVEQQITALRQQPQKNKAFASVAGVEPGRVPAYLRALTPVQLRVDTRVTNHGYRDGSATSYQAVMQAGTAVLVDARGVPRVRCACGNPLTPPAPNQSSMKATGGAWPGYRASNTVVVEPAPRVVEVFVIYDPDLEEWIERHKGDTGRHDKKTKPPKKSPTITGSPSSPTSPSTSSSSPSSETSSSSPETTTQTPPPTTTAPSDPVTTTEDVVPETGSDTDSLPAPASGAPEPETEAASRTF